MSYPSKYEDTNITNLADLRNALEINAGPNIKDHRPSVPRRLKCQYVVNMSIKYMFKKPSEKMV